MFGKIIPRRVCLAPPNVNLCCSSRSQLEPFRWRCGRLGDGCLCHRAASFVRYMQVRNNPRGSVINPLVKRFRCPLICQEVLQINPLAHWPRGFAVNPFAKRPRDQPILCSLEPCIFFHAGHTHSCLLLLLIVLYFSFFRVFCCSMLFFPAPVTLCG